MLTFRKIISLTLLFISVNTFAGLEELAQKKSDNYKTLINHYRTLLKDLGLSSPEEFCSDVKASYKNLTAIFNDDLNLIKTLRNYPIDDYREYATELEENSYSPLFAHESYTDACKKDDFNFSSLIPGMRNNVINAGYLEMFHDLWRTSYGPFKF